MHEPTVVVKRYVELTRQKRLAIRAYSMTTNLPFDIKNFPRFLSTGRLMNFIPKCLVNYVDDANLLK